ncbi:hypothetical protein EJ06DRAFT_329438 [Trichodelitschia bisporula]|uniref:DUF7924 domain-containing protein n=1 Tax=Trichodelitschia bisporula TaxID=703511 RepID=A0A6G1I2B3_9PEZI|nr:hypothetical protein EJ06DRAFT_329438 [Trichodelitschia bisporula]
MQMVGLHRAAVPHLQRAIFACAPYAPPVQDCCDLIFPFLAIETTLSQTHEEAMERNWHNGGAMLQGLRALHVKAKGPADAAWNFDMHCKALTIILSFDQVDIMAHWTRLNENHEVEYKCCFVENYPTKQPLIWPELVCVIRNAVKWKAGMEAIKENLSLVENSLHTSGATSESES